MSSGLGVGSHVRHIQSGRIGEIIVDDRSELPYKVQFRDGTAPEFDWFMESDVEPAPEAKAAEEAKAKSTTSTSTSPTKDANVQMREKLEARRRRMEEPLTDNQRLLLTLMQCHEEVRSVPRDSSHSSMVQMSTMQQIPQTSQVGPSADPSTLSFKQRMQMFAENGGKRRS